MYISAPMDLRPHLRLPTSCPPSPRPRRTCVHTCPACPHAPVFTPAPARPHTPVFTPVPARPHAPVFTPAPACPYAPVFTPAPAHPHAPVFTPVSARPRRPPCTRVSHPTHPRVHPSFPLCCRSLTCSLTPHCSEHSLSSVHGSRFPLSVGWCLIPPMCRVGWRPL